jgi:hypothetical protein
VNTEPLPGSLVTVTSPPIMRASLRVMASPSPVPPKRCAVAASAWLNSSNSLACCVERYTKAADQAKLARAAMARQAMAAAAELRRRKNR